jgi:hypothetical protein
VAATELFTQGRDLVKAGDFQKACPLFAESHRLDPKVGTLLNLAECEQRQGELAAALRAWQQAINLAEATNDRRGEVARARHDELSPRVPRLTVRLQSGAPAETAVFREKVQLGHASIGRAFPVDPGRHVITVTAPGRRSHRIVVSLREGEQMVVTVGPGPREQHVAAPLDHVPTPVQGGRSGTATSERALAYVAGGVGAAGVLVATITGLMLLDKRSTVDEHCDSDNRCDGKGLAAADDGQLLTPINTAAWLVGLAGVGTGAYLYFTTTPPEPSPGSGLLSSGLQGAHVGVRGAF